MRRVIKASLFLVAGFNNVNAANPAPNETVHEYAPRVNAYIILFPPNSAQLDAGSAREIDKAIQEQKGENNACVSINGFADFNEVLPEALSKARALAVDSRILGAGVRTQAITRWYGFNHLRSPPASNSYLPRMNMRVEVVWNSPYDDVCKKGNY